MTWRFEEILGEAPKTDVPSDELLCFDLLLCDSVLVLDVRVVGRHWEKRQQIRQAKSIRIEAYICEAMSKTSMQRHLCPWQRGIGGSLARRRHR